MKRFLSIAFLLFIFVSSLEAAYIDMTNIVARSMDLNMKESDYTFAMALTGMLSGTMLGLFLWKTK